MFSERQRALLAWVDASLDTNGVADDVFDNLTRHFTRRQIVEITIISGTYAMMGQLTRSLEIPIENSAMSIGSFAAYSSRP